MRNFFVHEKHVRYTPVSSSSSFQNACFARKSRVRKSNVRLGSFDFFSYRWVRFRSIVELNPSIEFDWVRLKFSSIGFDLLCRAFCKWKWWNIRSRANNCKGTEQSNCERTTTAVIIGSSLVDKLLFDEMTFQWLLNDVSNNITDILYVISLVATRGHSWVLLDPVFHESL